MDKYTEWDGTSVEAGINDGSHNSVITIINLTTSRAGDPSASDCDYDCSELRMLFVELCTYVSRGNFMLGFIR